MGSSPVMTLEDDARPRHFRNFASFALTTCNTRAFSSKFPCMRAHIVIIGAGISGLTAAITIGEDVEHLIAAGKIAARPEMTILEATDWIGGRARTDVLSTGVSVDAGPHWFHGGAKNPFYKWAVDRRYEL